MRTRIVIYLRNATRKHTLDEERVQRTARRLLEALGERDSSVSLSFVGDRAIRTLNRDYRGKNRATDVLSFSLVDPGTPARGAERQLGDIVISLDAAARQAKEYDVPLEREIDRLLIHGMLHLLGHDHQRAAERDRMASAERRLARRIGMPWPRGYRSGQ